MNCAYDTVGGANDDTDDDDDAVENDDDENGNGADDHDNEDGEYVEEAWEDDGGGKDGDKADYATDVDVSDYNDDAEKLENQCLWASQDPSVGAVILQW